MRLMTVNRPQPPQENIDIFAMLYFIETVLRELIIEALNVIDGPRWYRKCLPPDVLEKYRKGREVEKHSHWTQCIPHHPIYYLDFPDLKKIIEREDNWKKAFEHIFSRKDILSATLSELEPIRNKIAHNRKASIKDVEIVRGAYNMLSTAIGSDYFDSLLSRCTLAMDIIGQLVQLQLEAKNSLDICRKYGYLDGLEAWRSVHNKWWFDESYLNEKLDKIIEFFQVVEDYSHLPHSRGTGYKIEAWVKSSDLEAKYEDAQAQFDAILVNGGINYEAD